MTRSSKRMPQAMQQVGLLDGLVDPGFAVHAHHAEREVVRGGEGAEAEQRQATGICRRSAKVRTWSMAPDSMMPWPARMTGRLAARMSSMASLMAS